MILRNYLFSKEFDTYQQYPNDIAKQFLNQITSNQLSADQIVIHRDGNLIYYAYIQRVSTNKVFGHCIVTGDICININELYDLFHESFEQAAYKGVLFSFDSTGKICKQTENFSNEGAEVNEFFKDFNRIAGRKPLWKSIGSIDYSVSKDSKIYLSLTDDSNDKIVEAIEHYHNIIITIENPLASSYSNIVKQLNLDKEELNSRIEHLSNENDELLKTKKQYKWVAILGIIVVIFGVVLWNKVLFPAEVTRYEAGEFVYYGPIKDKKPHGVGVAIYHEDDEYGRKFYIGNFDDGIRNDNEAMLLYRSGDYFYGKMKNDKFDSGLFYKRSDGTYFDGLFENDQPYNGTWYDHKKAYELNY